MRFSEAARVLKMHPLELAVELAKHLNGQTFVTFYPDLPTDYLESIRAASRHLEPDAKSDEANHGPDVTPEADNNALVRRLKAGRLIVAMARKEYFEGNKVPEEKITKQYLQGMSSRERSEVLRELVRIGVLHKFGEGSSCRYSLNKKQRALIENVVAENT